MAETTEIKRSRSKSPESPAKPKEEKERKAVEKDRENSTRSSRKRARRDSEVPRFRAPSDRRIYVANLQYDTKWQDLKDVFREVVGDCEYIHLFEDEQGKPRGCGIVEFKEKASVEKALDKMHRYCYKGRNIVVKEDQDVARDETGRIVRGGRRSSRDDDSRGFRDHRGSSAGGRDSSRRGDGYRRFEDDGYNDRGMDGGFGATGVVGNTYGLNPQFLESLNIKGPLINRVFVANLDYGVSARKLREVFQLAGNVVDVHLNMDRDGKSRGHGVVVFDHPLESVQAISMLNGQMLMDRGMIVKMDRFDEPPPPASKLPSGLKAIGSGLGSGGKPLNVHRNIPTLEAGGGGGGGGGGSLVAGFPDSSNDSLPMTGRSEGNFGADFFSNGRRSGDGIAPSNRSVSYYMDGGPGGNVGSSIENLLGNGQNVVRRVDPVLNAMGPGVSGGIPVGNSIKGMGNFGGMGLLGNFVGTGGSGGGVGGGLGGGLMSDVLGDRGSDRFDDFRRSDFGTRDYSTQDILGDDSYRFAEGNPSTVFVHNLSSTCTPKALRDRFSDIGNVKYARISAQGVGIVCYSSDIEAQRAITIFNGARLDGRTIEVSYN